MAKKTGEANAEVMTVEKTGETETVVTLVAPEGTDPAEVAKMAAKAVAEAKKAPKAKANTAKKSPVGIKAAIDTKGRQLWRPGTNCGIIFDTFKKAGKKGITVEALIAAVDIESKNKPYLVKKLVGEFIQRGFSAKRNDDGKIVFIP